MIAPRIRRCALRASLAVAGIVAAAGAGGSGCACASADRSPPAGARSVIDPGRPPSSLASNAGVGVGAPLPDTSAPPPPREDGRLPPLATPTRYALRLHVDPTQPRFQGEAAIDVRVPAATRFIVLNGRGLTVTDAVARVAGKALRAEATARLGHGAIEPDELVLSWPDPLPAGDLTIAITYDAPFTTDLQGVYRVREAERAYAFSDFEPSAARRAFPCFDEPALKAPFEVAITVPSGMIAVTNAIETTRMAVDPGRGTDGDVRFDFAPTPPMPTYLFALAVGDLDVLPGPPGPVPIRAITVHGKSPLAAASLASASAFLPRLADYFGTPFPFAKLDLVAVPEFQPDAMENPGLITFREDVLLLDEKRTSQTVLRDAANTMAHELSHMWFGDYVTMRWWNDLWLNEGFATWMATKILDRWKPEWGTRFAQIDEMHQAMEGDALGHARAVRQPVASTGDAEEAFDDITYSKGASILRMLEHGIGEATFQRGVREYLQAHAWGTARAEDLLSALDHASGRDVTAIATTFLDRPGVPSVSIASSCAAGQSTIALTQSAWRPLGIAGKPTDAAPWRIPVCIGRAGSETCTELAGPSARVAIEPGAPGAGDAKGCAPWWSANATQTGYFRVALTEADARAIARDVATLDSVARVGFVSDLWAQVRAGKLAPSVLLDVLPAFDADPDPHVGEAVRAVLAGVSAQVFGAPARADFRAWVRARIAPHLRALGWTARPGEGDNERLARADLVGFLGVVARDPEVVRASEGVAARWLKDRASVEPSLASAALQTASLHAGRARFDQLRAVLRVAAPTERHRVIYALARLDDPALVRAVLDLTLTHDVKAQEVLGLIGRISGSYRDRPELAPLVLGWVEDHWDALRAKLPGRLAGGASALIGSTCTVAERDAAMAFFQPRLKGMDGVERRFEEQVESATACIALRAHASDELARYFARARAAR